MRSARWEASQWWPDAQEEANDRWLRALKGEARKGLLKNIRDGDAARARWLLERTDPRLAPPRLRQETLVDYLHKDEVFRLMREIGTEVAAVVVDEEMRLKIVRRVRVHMEPLRREVPGLEKEKGLPAG